MKNCYGCNREFVKKVKDTSKECICHKWLCGEDMDNTREYPCLKYLCQECYNEQRRVDRVQDRAERELTPGKKGKKLKRKEI